jgi:apolipoprotein N-acyltransferase
MKPHGKKLIAPIVITVLIVLYYAAFAAACILIRGIPVWLKLVGGIVPLLFAGVSVFVLIERIKEVRSGEEDDLSQY